MRWTGKGLPPGGLITTRGAGGCQIQWLSGPAVVAVLSRWRLSVTICAQGIEFVWPIFYDAFVFTFGFFIAYDDVYITVGVNISIRKILDSCTIVFLHMTVSFIMYLVRDDLINNWNQSINNAVQNIISHDSLQNLLDSIKEIQCIIT